MVRCLSHHPEVKRRCLTEIKKTQKFNMQTQKKFKPLYEQFEKMMGALQLSFRREADGAFCV